MRARSRLPAVCALTAASLPLPCPLAGRTDIIRLLLEAEPKLLDRRNADKATPLLVACMAGHQAAAVLLASKGADVEVRRCRREGLLGGGLAAGSPARHACNRLAAFC